MHFISITQRLFGSNGRYCGNIFEAKPIFPDSYAASIALYEEMWHRLRRDLVYKAKLYDQSTLFDAIILFSPSVTSEGKLRANILVNNANPNVDVRNNARRMLRHMDRLIYQLMSDGCHDISLFGIAKKFDTDQDLATKELKRLLKLYCRSQGLFVNETDLDYALAANKDRRREAHRAEHPEHFS